MEKEIVLSKMEKEIKFKLKIPKFFTSCKTQNLSEVIDHQNPIFTQENTIFLQSPLIERAKKEANPFNSPVLRPKQTPSCSSMMHCKPRCPETFDQMVRENCIISGNPFPRRKLAGKYTILSPSMEVSGGRRCPPASPASPLFSQKQGKKPKKKKRKNKNTQFINLKKNANPNQFIYSSSNESENGACFSSDDEKEGALKSISLSSKSISFSSDSDHANLTQTRTRSRPRTRRARPKREEKDTYAVVKSSSDPYNDFRTSMEEMIIEKQIFGVKELEELLHCFLSLNSPYHHCVILQVFTEIWDSLFSSCS
ncbi:unnamed protein product [Amaranthus hypochondriacus]